MQAQDRPAARGSGRRPRPRPRSSELEALVLLELLCHPQLANHICHLAGEVHAEEIEIEAAVGRLMAADLANREADAVSPAKAALRFDELWPISI